MRSHGVWGGLVALGVLVGCGNATDAPGESAGAGGDAPNAGAAGAQVAGSAPAGAAGEASGGEAGSDAAQAGAGGDLSGGSGGVGGTGGSAGADGTAGGSPIDIGAQQKSHQLDVLFVVDNSVSMADKQGVFSASLPLFLMRLANPRCLDAQGQAVAVQPPTGSVPCISGTREHAPVTDLHVGVITTSLGSRGGTVCAVPVSPDDHLDDRGELVPAVRTGIPSYQSQGFSSFDTSGAKGDPALSTVITQVQAAVNAAGQHGCGYEAPLEAMYRFLVDPEPPLSVDLVNNESTPTGINSALLAQRKAFLRPDSSLAIVVLSDENDCSVIDSGVGWFVASNSHMPRSTAACDVSPNDACCRSCATNEAVPPTGCAPLTQDPVCKDNPPGGGYVSWDAQHDSLNLRCYKQQERFGFDLLYPVERYGNALTNPKIANRAGALVDNPLFAARDGKGPRSATLVSLSTIVGAPWQDFASTGSIAAGSNIRYLSGAELESQSRWAVALGNPKADVDPTDVFMTESVGPRTGSNPLTGTVTVAASSTNPKANAINGHEQNVPDLSDLQYACTFALATPKVCLNGDSACDCSPDKNGDLAAVVAANSPLCQPPAGGAPIGTQYFGKAYPGLRELGVARQLGARAVAASICPKTVSAGDALSPDYAYGPAFDALTRRLAQTLE